jgi:putative ATP-binding cassette transporter
MKTFNLKFNFIVLIIICIVDLSMTSYLVMWREAFWQSVNDRHLQSFLHLLYIFSAVAIGLCIVSGIETYLQNKIALNWRRILTRKAFKIKDMHLAEGHQQRIQEDCRDYPLLIIGFLQYILMQGVLVIFYIYTIYNHAGLLYVLIPVAYGVLGTGLGYYIAHPLIHLNYVNQVLEAAFRQSLTKLDYGRVHRNNHKMFVKSKHLQYFQYFYGQISVIFPYLILAPIYFGGVIAFGVFMQIASTISHLTDSLGSIVNNFDKINKMLSCRKRLHELGVI